MHNAEAPGSAVREDSQSYSFGFPPGFSLQSETRSVNQRPSRRPKKSTPYYISDHASVYCRQFVIICVCAANPGANILYHSALPSSILSTSMVGPIGPGSGEYGD